jgi:glycerol-3-phosphate dehydrogenase
MVQRLEDLVLRRLEHAALGQLSGARLTWSASAMAAALGWNEARRQSELEAVLVLLRRHRHAPPDAAAAETSAPAVRSSILV